MLFYIGTGLQVTGFTSVGLCLFSGLNKGDYGKLELIQFVGGFIIFYLGHFLKARGAR